MRNELIGTTNGAVTSDPQGPVVAGSAWAWTLTYTAGSAGIADGGSVRFEIPYGFTAPQLTEPADPGYVTATCSRPGARLKLSLTVPVTLADEPFYYVTRWGRMVYVQILEEALQEGDTLTFVYGSTKDWGLPLPLTQHFAQEVEFTVATDVDGTRSAPFSGYTLLAEQPVIEVIGASPTHLAVVAPSLVQAGEPFSLRVAARDVHRNLSPEQPGTVALSAVGDDLEMLGGQGDEGGLELRVQLDHPGCRLVEVETPDTALRGTSNPIRCLPERPHLNLFWGDIHGHSGLSDGLGSADAYYYFGREQGLLDFCALTDHAQYLSDEDWEETQEATRRHHDPGRFVTLLGYEYSCNASLPHYGDKCIYYPGASGRLLRETDIHRSPHHDPVEFTEEWKAQGAMMIVHQHALGSCTYYDPDLVRLAEAYSIWGASESDSATRPLLPSRHHDYQGHLVADALERGMILGLCASSDDHAGRPGCTDWLRVRQAWPGGLVAVWATELTREAVWQALWNRRCYGTTGARIILEFSVDGEPMGSLLQGNSFSDSHRLQAHIVGTAPLHAVEVLRGRQVIHHLVSDSPALQVDLLDCPPAGSANYYYLRVTQADGEMAWSSPVWVM